jgi:DnaJ-class molecular chaperone
MTCQCARHRYELLIEYGISTPDFCPACSGGTEVDEEGFPVLNEHGEPVICTLCKGRGMIYEPCCEDCSDGPVITIGIGP